MENKPRFVGQGTLIQGKVSFGKNVWIGNYVILDGLNRPVYIGDNSVISDGVKIYTHDTSYRTLFNKPKKVAPVSIGVCTQIGADTVILCGVSIGDHVIVGANSVVNKNVDSYQLVAGNPIKTIKVWKKPGQLR